MSAGIKANNDGSAAIQVGGVDRVAIALDGQQSSVIPGGSTLYPEYKCRSWVNFNGTGTVAIRASGNVTSITDNGTGQYTVNFTTSMPDVNYCAVPGSNGSVDTFSGSGLGRMFASIRTRQTGTVEVQYIDDGGSLADPSYCVVSVFR